MLHSSKTMDHIGVLNFYTRFKSTFGSILLKDDSDVLLLQNTLGIFANIWFQVS